MKHLVVATLLALSLATNSFSLRAATCTELPDSLTSTTSSLDFNHALAFPVETTSSTTDSSHPWGVAVDALFFFKDNEFDGNISKGYTLPGVRLQPRLTFAPRRELQFEMGLNALIYDGANKFPNYAFHDIAKWKGNQYQAGAHLLPFVRAKVNLGNAEILFGHIDGGGRHRLILPMYNPESQLTAEPELGAQLRIARQRWTMDLWVDWQSFIFEQDTHQEAFTVGLTQRLRLTSPSRRHFSLEMPLQVLAQHRGGEQDLPALNLGVQTLCNAALGMQGRWTFDSNPLNALEAEAHALLSYQQAGKLWPFDTGVGMWTALLMEWLRSLRFRVGVFHARDFASLYGSPFFGTLSLKEVGGRFSRMTTGYWSVEYARYFGRDYCFGAKLNGYLTAEGTLLLPHDVALPARWGNAFSFGIFLRATPRFFFGK